MARHFERHHWFAIWLAVQAGAGFGFTIAPWLPSQGAASRMIRPA